MEGEICGTLLNDNIFGSSSNSDNPVEVFFNRKISNSDEGEICTRLIKCGCIRLWEESPKERYGIVLICFLGPNSEVSYVDFY